MFVYTEFAKKSFWTTHLSSSLFARSCHNSREVSKYLQEQNRRIPDGQQLASDVEGHPGPNQLQRKPPSHILQQQQHTGRGAKQPLCPVWDHHHTPAVTASPWFQHPTSLSPGTWGEKKVKSSEAAGPDGIPGTVIKACADQLAGILTKIFNLSLTQATVPTCLKASIIVPIPKKTAIDSLSD